MLEEANDRMLRIGLPKAMSFPRFHQFTSALQRISAAIGSLRLIADHMSQRRLGVFTRDRRDDARELLLAVEQCRHDVH